jgi:hypothetical protein
MESSNPATGSNSRLLSLWGLRRRRSEQAPESPFGELPVTLLPTFRPQLRNAAIRYFFAMKCYGEAIPSDSLRNAKQGETV